jgi:uncharacterized membrane-anchored protein YitT (DUF2179 family)
MIHKSSYFYLCFFSHHSLLSFYALFVIAKTFNFSFFEYYQDIFIYYKEKFEIKKTITTQPKSNPYLYISEENSLTLNI